jgi:protoheme IX farnesyltransferase
MHKHTYKDTGVSPATSIPADIRGVISEGRDETLSFAARLHAFAQLTKPKIMLLVLVTGAVSLFLEGSLVDHPVRFILVLVGLYLSGGAANAFNQFFERDIDSLMARTRLRRPLPRGVISPRESLAFSVFIAFAGVALFAAAFNLLSAILALSTIAFYSFFYTLLLKPNTVQNIVIGGAAGAMGPVIAWAAASGTISWTAGILFLIVFFWTPPHFWSLALFCREDYKLTGLPMLPVVKGYAATLRAIIIYAVLTGVVSLLLVLTGAGWLYAGGALLLGFEFVRKALRVRSEQSRQRERELFTYSILYLFLVFGVAVIDYMAL